MWTRAELKANAKALLKSNYGDSIAACIIITVISLAVSGLTAVFYFVPVFNVFVSYATVFFLTSPLTVGLSFYFMQNRVAPPMLSNIFFSFESSRYMSIIGAMAWMYLFLMLWTLIPISGVLILCLKWTVFSLPTWMTGRFYFDSAWILPVVLCGIIYIAGLIIVIMKAISYSMTPYILTDNPHIGYARALRLSIAMTNGWKWDIFVLALSFLGWILLSVLTLLIGFIFLAPYIKATYAELYGKLRDNAINSGLTTPEELHVYLK